MNICILFILFNGMSFVTPACYPPTMESMIVPQDVIYVEQLPYEYIELVYESPSYYYNHYRHYKRHVFNWSTYRYSPRHHRRYARHRHRRNYRHHNHHVYHWRNLARPRHHARRYKNRRHKHRHNARRATPNNTTFEKTYCS